MPAHLVPDDPHFLVLTRKRQITEFPACRIDVTVCTRWVRKPGHLLLHHNFSRCEPIYKTFHRKIPAKTCYVRSNNRQPHLFVAYER